MSLLSKALEMLAVRGSEAEAKRAAEALAARKARAEAVARASRPVAQDAPRATLNIGLHPSTSIGGAPIKSRAVERAIRRTGRTPSNVAIVQSGSEPTFVADIQPPLSQAEGHSLSEQFRQDAIAQHLGGLSGELHGPRPENFGGAFSPGYFYTGVGDTIGAGRLTDMFHEGAPREALTEAAAGWGTQIDPAALDVVLRIRDNLRAAGKPLPEGLGLFTGNEHEYNPDNLQVFREAQRALREREVAESARGDRSPSTRALADLLPWMPEEETLQRLMRQTELPLVYVGGRDRVGSGGRGVHIGREGGLSTLEPSFYGTGHRGAEYNYVQEQGLPSRSYMYVGDPGTIHPELSVLGVRGDRMHSPRYAYTAPLEGLYDVNADPERLVRMAKAYNLQDYKPMWLPEWAVQNKLMGTEDLKPTPALGDMTRWIVERGYPGYISDYGSSRAAALFGPTPVEPLGEVTDWRKGFAVGGRVQA